MEIEIGSPFASFGPNGVDYAPHNKGITPVFFIEAVLDHAATEKEGRTIYCEKERVGIHIAGDPFSVATHPVTKEIVSRFREEYEAWKKNMSGSHIRGTPLKVWPLSTPRMIKELEAIHVFSVEDLASVSDGNIHYICDGRLIRDRAIAWLAAGKDGAAVTRYASEASRLREEVEELKRMVSESVQGKPAAGGGGMAAAPQAEPPQENRVKAPARTEAASPVEAASRGRTGLAPMSQENRAKASERMKAYWTRRKAGRADDAPDAR